ncbi:squalene monooxygenase [Naegleria gruberi]|uniref:Squalene monooxygenase n=1 Tax=Naegleria gruberi TaxID=5762 RepID=D2V252_NAEGR|nr:squalene monooxygenase [Naegleria gruberi]EFC48843.1 squalene monooxygenase [Naegleria gruberi]|eukprot:XP_002681587.1 squalene monooxygenase [Naegleria gruberi strain NEG-M]
MWTITGCGLVGLIIHRILNKFYKLLTLPKPSFAKKDYDVVIVGGGIGGCALGSALSKAGKNVLVLERDMSEPDRIIGELLQPGGVQHLKDLGLGHCLEGIDAARVFGYQVFYGDDEQVNLPYPIVEGGRAEGRSFHYGRFIMNLRRACEQDGATLLERTVVSLIEKTPGLIEGVQYKKNNNDSTVDVTCKLVIICNGAGSSFTRQVRSDRFGNKPLVVSQFIGLELADSAEKLPKPNHGNVFVLPTGPVCFTQTLPKRGEEMTKYLLEYIMPHLPENLHESFKAEVDASRIKVVQNREMPGETPESLTKKGVVLIGDAMNCRHPITGGGMTVTFSDCKELVKAIIQIKDLNCVSEVDEAIQSFYSNRKKVASTINILANALYSILAPSLTVVRNDQEKTIHKDDTVSLLRRAVFRYLQRGSFCQTGPLSLLSGLWHSPYGLLFHFFSVALLGSVDLIKEGGILGIFGSLYKSLKMITGATTLIAPLIAEERLLSCVFPRFFWKRTAPIK